MLIKGAVAAAREGNRDAALQAQHAAVLILGDWQGFTPHRSVQ